MHRIMNHVRWQVCLSVHRRTTALHCIALSNSNPAAREVLERALMRNSEAVKFEAENGELAVARGCR